MNEINAMALIDLAIVLFGVYFFYLSRKMKKTGKIPSYVVAEESLKKCKKEREFAEFLAPKQTVLSLAMIFCGSLMFIHETVRSLGCWHYGIVALLVISLLLYYKQLTDGRMKFC